MCSLNVSSDDERWVFYLLEYISFFTGHCKLGATSGVCRRRGSVPPGHLPGDGVQKRADGVRDCSLPGRGVEWMWHQGCHSCAPKAVCWPQYEGRASPNGFCGLFPGGSCPSMELCGFFFSPSELSRSPEHPMSLQLTFLLPEINAFALHACKVIITFWIHKHDLLWEAFFPFLGCFVLYIVKCCVHTSHGACFP